MSPYRISFLATGAELLNGRVHEANSYFVAEELSKIGLSLSATLVVGDHESEIVAGLQYLELCSDLIIITGGLGPTSDDVTREAVARLNGVPLVEDLQARHHLEQFYAQRKRSYDPSNSKQTLLPQGAELVPNPNGTAPGFWARSARGVSLVALPGVPREQRAMFFQTVLPRIQSQVGSKLQRVALCFFGVPESRIGAVVDELAVPAGTEVSYRAHFPVVYLQFKGPDLSELERLGCAVQATIGGDFVFAEGGDRTLDGVLHDLLLSTQKTIAVAESCTAGLVGALLTKHGGSSAYFRGGVMSYANDLKRDLLGVTDQGLTEHGAVSAEVASQMAQGARLRLGADIGLSITGVAGPGGGTDEKPVGLFYIGWSDAVRTTSFRFLFVSSRDLVRDYAAHAALDVVRRRLLGLPVRNILGGLAASP